MSLIRSVNYKSDYMRSLEDPFFLVKGKPARDTFLPLFIFLKIREKKPERETEQVKGLR